MRRSADVVIRMLLNSDNLNIKLLFPLTLDWEQWACAKPDVLFSEKVIDCLNALSASLLKDKQSRIYPDVITFAFFCRKANLLAQKKQYVGADNEISGGSIRLGRGVLFHVAPSNVPINFGYSLIAGLLSGNHNVVRVSSKEFPQVDLIVRHLIEMAESQDYREVFDRIALVKYDRSSDATAFFSSFCHVRVIWGGDDTINQIRKSQIPARSFDVTFADRYSMAVINADELVNERNMRKVAESFYNDTYLFDQNACSAPHLIVWLGKLENMEKAQEIFWTAVQDEVKRKYEFQAVLAVDKLTAFYRQAIAMDIQKEPIEDNTLVRVKLKQLSPVIDEFRCAGGYFSEYVASSLDEMAAIVKNRYQTLAYYGLNREELNRFVVDNRLVGIDRIVPLGETTSFSFTWDGYNLIQTLSRECIVL